MKKIYFAGSIRGGRADEALYRQIIEHIQKTDIVLTEHVGNLALSKMENLPNRDEAIYQQDTAWLRESDMVIAECTTPSLGVGYELAYAERFGIPVHIFYDITRTRLSAMLTGDSYYHIHPYSSPTEIFPVIDTILGE